MKSIKCLVIILITIFLLIPKTSAMNTEYSVSDMTEEQKNKVIEVNELKLIEKDVYNEFPGFLCFDVNDDKLVAIGFRTFFDCYVCVYDERGKFKYGYSFFAEGSFDIEWDKSNQNNLIIYDNRSGISTSIDPEGNYVDIKKIDETVENSLIGQKVIRSHEKTVDNAVYIMRNNRMLLPFYLEIVVINENGIETVLFDKTPTNIIPIVLATIGILLLASFIIFAIIIKKKKHRARATSSNSTLE